MLVRVCTGTPLTSLQCQRLAARKKSLALSTLALPLKDLAPALQSLAALKTPVLQGWSLALVLQSLAFALERQEQLLELSFHHKGKILSRPSRGTWAAHWVALDLG